MRKVIRVLVLVVIGGGSLQGCSVTKPIDVTPELIRELGHDPASACMINQGKASNPLYGEGNVTSTFCRTNTPQGSLSVDQKGTITIIHGPQPAPTVNMPVSVGPVLVPPK
jgi:hypothetical protein